MHVTRAIAAAAIVATIAVPHANAAPRTPLDRAAIHLATAPAALAHTAGARDLLAILDAGGDDAVVALATRATRIHAADIGVTVTTPRSATHDYPSAAAAAIARRYGVTPDASLHDLDRLPAHVRRPLTGVLNAFLAYDAAATLAYADADHARMADMRTRQDHDGTTTLRDLGVDLGPVLGARLALLDAAMQLRDAATDQKMAAEVSLCPALAIDLTSGPTTYPVNCGLVIDAIGDDTYLNNAGGGCLVPPAGALLDFDGDDTYDPVNSPCANGAGFAGAGFLLDTDGDDSYSGQGAGTANGGGVLGGTGMLVDTDGDDAYLCAGMTAVNGGAVIGSGMLLDLDGADAYTAGSAANGGAAIAGAGLLVDADDNDTYTTTQSATNGGGAAAAGFLLDVRGDDVYTSGGTASNGGAFGGTGFLFDVLGDDTYTAGAQLSNGGGGLGGVGVLLDADGVDSYTTTSISGNGSGAFGVGLLLDGGGTGDTYTDEAGTATDQTVVPKILAGAQVDVAR